MFADLDRRLQYGPGMRVQRMVEALLLIATFFTGDVRPAYVAVVLTGLEALSPRLVPVALAVSAFVPPPQEHRLGDLYFDLAGSRGACAISVFVQSGAIWLVQSGHEVIGYLILAMPTASFVLSPTVGFCCGSSVYVGMRELLVRVGIAKRYAHGACDVETAPRHQ